MKRFFRIRLHVVLILLLSLMGSQAGSMGFPHHLFSGKRIWKKHVNDARLPKKTPLKVESLSRSAWVSSPSECEESDSSVAQSLVRVVSDWLGNLLQFRSRSVAVRVGMPVELLKQTHPLTRKTECLRVAGYSKRLDVPVSIHS